MQDSLFHPASAMQTRGEKALTAKLQGRHSTFFLPVQDQIQSPAGRMILRVTAKTKAPHIRQDFSSVPTPNTPSGGPNSKSTAAHTGGMDLEGAVSLATVATPKATDGSKGGPNQRGSKGGLTLPSTACLATVATPSARDWNRWR